MDWTFADADRGMTGRLRTLIAKAENVQDWKLDSAMIGAGKV